MSVLIGFGPDSLTYKNLRAEWRQSEYYGEGNWLKYVKSLPGVIDVVFVDRDTFIKFDSEASMTLFLLRWS